jgi:hypothetical protein
LTAQKLSAGEKLTSELKTKQKKDLADERFEKVLADLTPRDWQKSRDQLYANEQLFSENLSGNKKTDALNLIKYFRSIDQGDKLAAGKEMTAGRVEEVLSLYRAAGETAKSLSSGIDVRFLTNLKLASGEKLTAELQRTEQRNVAEAKFNEALAMLTPEEWEKSRDQLYANEQVFSEHLERNKKTDALNLINFFRDIDEGDRLLAGDQAGIAELEAAQAFYRRAEGKAELMQQSVDALFVPRQRIDESSSRLAQLRAAEQERLAAQRAAEAQEQVAEVQAAPAAAAPVVAKKTEEVQKIYLPRTELKLAMVNFNKKNYETSLNHFSHVYKDQIKQIKGKGKKRLLGVMALPKNYRAEVLFLLHYDRLRKRYKDEEMVRDGMSQLYNKVENGSGIWAIVSERKRSKITRHIEGF